VVRDVDDAMKAVRRVAEVDRDGCRQVFKKRFTASRMADNYMEVYERMVRGTAQHYAEVAGPRAHRSASPAAIVHPAKAI